MFAIAGLIIATIGWGLRAAPGIPVGAVLVVGVAGSVGATVGGVDGYPWSNLVVLAVALAGGILLGRAIPPRARPMLLVLCVLAVLDATQLVLAGGTGGSPSESWFYLLMRGDDGNLFMLGIADLVVVVALAIHGARRMHGFWPAVLPGPVGLAIALVYNQVLRSPGGLVLIPFLLAGWILVELVVRSRAPRPVDRLSPPPSSGA